MSEEMIAVNAERYKKILKKEVPKKLFELKEKIETLEKELDNVKKENEQYRQVFENLKSSDDVALPDFSETVKRLKK